MYDTKRRGYFWRHRVAVLGMGGLLFLGGYLTALWAPLQTTGLTVAVQAAAEHQEHGHMAPHDHTAHEVDLAPFMIRNAYHFATLYHAARAERWEQAAYQAEELAENLIQAARVGGPYAQSLKDFLKEQVQPLRKTITSQNTQQFRTAFQATVEGCNDCHKATQHAFI